MKKAVLLSLVILLLSVAVVFAQSDQSAVSANADKAKVKNATQAQKVQTEQEEQTVMYDAKGGIIVPNASKGFRQKSLTPEQQRILNRVLEARKNKIAKKEKAQPVSRDMNASRKQSKHKE